MPSLFTCIFFPDVAEDCPIFGVPLEVAVERNRCHDGIPLPMVVRQCIDYIEVQIASKLFFVASEVEANKLERLSVANVCREIGYASFTRKSQNRSDCTKSDGELGKFLSLHPILCNRTDFGSFV